MATGDSLVDFLKHVNWFKFFELRVACNYFQCSPPEMGKH